MGTGQGGLRTGWLAAFGTEGYEGEPPLLEELGVNFRHIQVKVGVSLGRVRWREADVWFCTDTYGAQSDCANRQ